MSKYSQMKPAWHFDRIEQMRRGEPTAPVHVQLVISDLCNHDCAFCAYRISNGLSSELFVTSETRNPNRRIETSKAMEIVEDCAVLGVKAIQFTGGGEPTVHRDHIELFAYAQNFGMDTALVTNGVRLDPEADAVQRMTWIRVSVDAGTEETYCAVRRVAPSHWRKAWAHIGALATGGYAGTLGVGFVVTPDNFREIGECARICREHGVKNMRVGAVFSSDGVGFYGDLIPEILDTIAAAQDEHGGDGFELIDLFGRRLGDLRSGQPSDPFCGYQQLTMYIGADLNVYRCCNTAYTAAGKLGDLRGVRLAQLVPRLDYTFDARACSFCQFGGQNAAITALVRRPEHENFV